MDLMEKNIRELYAQILQPQEIELVSISDGSTAEPNPQDFNTEITQRTMAEFKKGENTVYMTFYSADKIEIEKSIKSVQLEFALKP